GWIVTYDNATTAFSANLQLSPGDWGAFAGAAVNNRLLFGADAPFGRIGVKLQVSANWNVTLAYQYWNGAWTNLTTQETITWTVTSNPIDSYASWQFPSDWIAHAPAGLWPSARLYKYWMSILISAVVSVTTEPRIGF